MQISNKLFSYDETFRHGQMRTESAEIYQIAELSLVKSGEIPQHIQVCDEITYVISGKATVYAGDRVQEMSAGQIHFIRKGEYHRIVADQNHNFHFCCIGYHPNSQCEGIRVFLEETQKRDTFFVEDEGNIRMLFEQLINEFYIRDEESKLMIHFYFCQMLVQLYRILTGKSREKRLKVNTDSSNEAVYRTLRYIDSEYPKITTVRQVAQALSYSEYYLSHIFKEKMEVTVKDYIMQKKIIAAAGLLKNSNMSITEISEQLCFASLHTFGLAFKRYMHMSPSQFRSQDA